MERTTAQRCKNAAGPMPFAAPRQRKTFETGQSLLEFALMLPFLTLLGVGVVDIGRAIFYTITVNNGATAGAEYGSQSRISAVDTAGMQSAATQDANFSVMTATATWGCTCDTGAGTSCTYPVPLPNSCTTISCSTGQIVQCIQVTTHATFSPLFHYPGLPTSYQANGRAVMRVRH